MFTPDPAFMSVLLLVVTPTALVMRAWLKLRQTVVEERARTERQRLALDNALPGERPAILRALHPAEPSATQALEPEEGKGTAGPPPG